MPTKILATRSTDVSIIGRSIVLSASASMPNPANLSLRIAAVASMGDGGQASLVFRMLFFSAVIRDLSHDIYLTFFKGLRFHEKPIHFSVVCALCAKNYSSVLQNTRIAAHAKKTQNGRVRGGAVD